MHGIAYPRYSGLITMPVMQPKVISFKKLEFWPGFFFDRLDGEKERRERRERKEEKEGNKKGEEGKKRREKRRKERKRKERKFYRGGIPELISHEKNWVVPPGKVATNLCYTTATGQY